MFLSHLFDWQLQPQSELTLTFDLLLAILIQIKPLVTSTRWDILCATGVHLLYKQGQQIGNMYLGKIFHAAFPHSLEICLSKYGRMQTPKNGGAQFPQKDTRWQVIKISTGYTHGHRCSPLISQCLLQGAKNNGHLVEWSISVTGSFPVPAVIKCAA